MIVAISVDAYPFLYSYSSRCFLVELCHLIVKRLNLEVATISM